MKKKQKKTKGVSAGGDRGETAGLSPWLVVHVQEGVCVVGTILAHGWVWWWNDN